MGEVGKGASGTYSQRAKHSTSAPPLNSQDRQHCGTEEARASSLNLLTLELIFRLPPSRQHRWN